jgi:methionyl-tRNA synthetase
LLAHRRLDTTLRTRHGRAFPAIHVSNPPFSKPLRVPIMAKKTKPKSKKRKKTTHATKKKSAAGRVPARKAAGRKSARKVKLKAGKARAAKRKGAKAKAPKSKPRKPKAAIPKAAKPKNSTPKTAEPTVAAPGNKLPFYVTTAIFYPNGPPHIGHAYEAIATDAIARFMQLDGYDVFFLTGTDEHGMKMQQTAANEGLTARELRDRNVPLFEKMVARLECSNDDFIHTTEERHHRSSEEIWRRMEKNGDIYLDKYAGWYSVRDEAYYAESETHLNEQKVRVSSKTGTPVDWVEEESYFFRLSAYADKLLKLYEKPNFVLPKERLNEVASFVRGGLQDLSISRTTFDWGVRVPGDDKHIMYVWVDALTNYITGVGFPDDRSAMFRRYWPAALHVIGKDIVRFHAVYWPAFLMSAGIDVPRHIFSHGFLFNRGEKMSKSVGNVVDPFALCDAYGVDQLRYFFLREVPFGQDGNYSHEAIVNRINADLANDLGNLAQRSLSMVAKAFGGKLPEPGAFTSADEAILAAADAMVGKARDFMKTQQLHQVLATVWAVVADANRYFASEEPWAKAKTDPKRQGTILYVTAEVLRQVAILAQPYMPSSAANMLDQLAIPAERRSFSELNGDCRVKPGVTLPPPKPVFPRYVEPEEKA